MIETSENKVLSGAFYLIRGLRLLGHQDLRAFIIIPLIINIILFSAGIWLTFHGLHVLQAWLAQWLPSWLTWLYWLFAAILLLASALFWVYLSTFLANLLAAPFNGFLAQRVERLALGQPKVEEPFNLGSEIAYTVKQQLRLLVYYLPRLALCLLLFIIPVVQLAAGVIWIGFNVWMMALQYMSYPMENHRLTFKQIRQRLHQERGLQAGFGGAIMLLSLVPLLNFLVMPAAVIGAALLWAERYQAPSQS